LGEGITMSEPPSVEAGPAWARLAARGETPSHAELTGLMADPEFAAAPSEPGFELLEDGDRRFSFRLTPARMRTGTEGAVKTLMGGVVLVVASIGAGAATYFVTWDAALLLRLSLLLVPLLAVGLVLLADGLKSRTLVMTFEILPGGAGCRSDSALGSRRVDFPNPPVKLQLRAVEAVYMDRTAGTELVLRAPGGKPLAFGWLCNERTKMWMLAKMAAVLGPGALD